MGTKNNKTFKELFDVAKRTTATYNTPLTIPVKTVQDRSPVVELVNHMLQDALEKNASDIHIEPGQISGRLRYRLDGRLETVYGEIPMELYSNIISRIKIMGQLNIAENRLPQDGRCSVDYNGQVIDVRISIVPLINGEKAVLRLLNRAGRFMDIDSLSFTADNQEKFISLCREANGAVLMAGPVNSGKTTALYGALHYLNDNQKNIVTIEDPVEYQLAGINQIQINPRIRLDFEEALKAVLRQDYDILAIGEVRSDAVAGMLVKSALTGHLVFATLHTASAAQAIYRLLDMGIKPFLLASALRGIVAQRLLPRLCPACRVQYEVEPDSGLAQALGKNYKKGLKAYHRQGCAKCQGRGIQGRIALQEVLLINSELQQCISQRPTIGELEQAILHHGAMKTIWQDGMTKARQGLVELEEVIKACSD